VTKDASDQIVSEILAISRRNNATAGVTGLLLYDGKRFLQALEGSEAAVSTTYERIKLDTRHRGIVLLSSKVVEARSFGDWSMQPKRSPKPRARRYRLLSISSQRVWRTRTRGN